MRFAGCVFVTFYIGALVGMFGASLLWAASRGNDGE